MKIKRAVSQEKCLIGDHALYRKLRALEEEISKLGKRSEELRKAILKYLEQAGHPSQIEGWDSRFK